METGIARRRNGAWKMWTGLAVAAILWVVAWTNLHSFADFVSYTLLGLRPGTHLGEAVNFFFYDVPKILLLLTAMIFVITVIRTFFSPEKTRRMLGGKQEGIGNVLAALLGVVTPFCSCSAVPLFIGFVEAGIPLGVTFSFLIATPVVNEVALVMLLGLFGLRVAGIYMLSGLTIAVISGMVLGRLGVERYIEDFVFNIRVGKLEEESSLTWEERIREGVRVTGDILRKVTPYVLVGIAVGAGIHGYVPQDFLADVLGKENFWVIPLAVLIGAPLYSNAVGMIPVVHALVEKGVALGTALAFMMATVGISLPESVLLRRVLKPQLLGIFLGIVAVAVTFTGYLLNFIL